MRLHSASVLFVFALFSCISNAATWTEFGDAGEVPATAQQVLGTGTLDAITGTISSLPSTHVDMFEIYIPGSSFSATASIPPPPDGDPSFNGPQLFLFDQNGMGVYASQEIQNAHISIPITAGIYQIAVSPWNIDPFGPKDEFGFDERIWLKGSSLPDGPAASLPVSGWGGTYSAVSSGYTITLSGAEFISTVPIPPTLLLFGSGLLGLIGIAREKA